MAKKSREKSFLPHVSIWSLSRREIRQTFSTARMEGKLFEK